MSVFVASGVFFFDEDVRVVTTRKPEKIEKDVYKRLRELYKREGTKKKIDIPVMTVYGFVTRQCSLS